MRLFQSGSNTWLTAETWPLDSRPESLYFDGEQMSVAAPVGSDRARSYRYDPVDPVVPLDSRQDANVAAALRAAPIDQGYLRGAG